MNFIPKVNDSSYSKYSTVAVNYDGQVGRISDIDPIKVISKFSNYHKATGVGFVDENGLEYSVLVGTKTSPINCVIIQIFDSNNTSSKFYSSLIETSVQEQEYHFLSKSLSIFVSWLRQQNVLRDKVGD